METTPTSSRYKKCRNEDNSKDSMVAADTYVDYGSSDYLYSYLSSTQEANDTIDVLWDWNSPQGERRTIPRQRRCATPVHSPQIVPTRRSTLVKRQNSNLNRLHEELLALKRDISLPIDEEALRVSPVQESEFKYVKEPAEQQNVNNCSVYDDLFNDSIDEHMLFCSQQVDKILSGDSAAAKGMISSVPNTMVAVTNKTHVDYSFESDDDFDAVFSRIPQAEIDRLTQAVKPSTSKIQQAQRPPQSPRSIVRSKSDVVDNNQATSIRTATVMSRTKSFEISNAVKETPTLTRAQLQQIEKKRQEALNKLKNKRCHEAVLQSTVKCSPEEIEKKRQEALAKLEAKKLQTTVEQRRQEAKRRL